MTDASSSDPGDILVLAAGEYQLSVAANSAGIYFSKRIEIRGAKYGIDARGRSTVGKGNGGYTDSGDPLETTIVGKSDVTAVIFIAASNVIIDGITVTSNSVSDVYAFNVLSSSSTIKDIIIRNCVIRHLGSPESENVIYGMLIEGNIAQTLI